MVIILIEEILFIITMMANISYLSYMMMLMDVLFAYIKYQLCAIVIKHYFEKFQRSMLDVVTICHDVQCLFHQSYFVSTD